MGAALAYQGAVDMYLFLGMLGQAGFAGVSSAQDVSRAYATATQLCERNAALHREYEEIQKALAAGAITSAMFQTLTSTAVEWHGYTNDLQKQVIATRSDYVTQFTYFLFFLAFTTTMFFFALEKKGGRLDRLFAKIDKIKAFTAKSANANGN